MTPLRERFIADLERIWGHKQMPDVSLVPEGQKHNEGQVGRFRDRKVHQMWLGYQLAHGANHQEITQDERHLYMGTYVVARVDGKKPVFSRAPYRHLHRKLAEAEVDRLTAEHGNQFSIWRCVYVGPEPVAAIEPVVE